jgi:hypothetical protein
MMRYPWVVHFAALVHDWRTGWMMDWHGSAFQNGWKVGNIPTMGHIWTRIGILRSAVERGLRRKALGDFVSHLAYIDRR